jgi:hypothetical protein
VAFEIAISFLSQTETTNEKPNKTLGFWIHSCEEALN